MPVHAFPGVPSVGDAVSGVINDIAQAIWTFTDSVLTATFSLVDANTLPSIVYTPNGPLGKVYPITLWIGIVLVVMFSFAQIGKIAASAGQGIAAFGKGLVLYAITFAVGLGLLDLLGRTAATTANGILAVSFGSGNWSNLSTSGTFIGASVKNLTGFGLAAMSLFLILPFALMFLAEMIIREGAMEILAATLPIIAAGVVHEKFARWYWTGLRWMLALIFMLPVIAIAMTIGHSIALTAGTASGGGATSNLANAMVGATVSDMSLVMPLALFKLFAFVDPNTASGQSFRGGLPFGLGGSSSGDSSSSSPADTASSSGTGSGGSSGGSGKGDDDSSSSDSDPSSMKPSMQPSTEGGMDGGMSAAQSGLMSAAQSLFSTDPSKNAAHAGESMDLVGVGHPGSQQAGSEDAQDSEDSQDSSGQDGPDQDSYGSGGPQPPSSPMPDSLMPDSPMPDSPMLGGSPGGAPGGGGAGGEAGGAAGGDAAAAAVVV